MAIVSKNWKIHLLAVLVCVKNSETQQKWFGDILPGTHLLRVHNQLKLALMILFSTITLTNALYI